MNKFKTLKHALKLESDIIGVKLVYEHSKDDIIYSNFKNANKMERYCEYVKRASKGEFLKIEKADFLCETGEIMLGFKNSNNIELGMRLDVRGLTHVLLFPINKYNLKNFDSILLIVTPRNCMDIVEAYVKLYKRPLKLTCGAITGICSEVTAHVIKREEINFSFLCSNSRFFAGFNDCEMLCGIPAKMTIDLIDEIVKISHERDANTELLRQLNK
ncbi:MAG: hypothetical protein EU532_13270 [Promethearchaeota archaeon]|nr:MAG: hypothetical protein EU532_13270 [Candidatus Lokiarchaeota archaeon]